MKWSDLLTLSLFCICFIWLSLTGNPVSATGNENQYVAPCYSVPIGFELREPGSKISDDNPNHWVSSLSGKQTP